MPSLSSLRAICTPFVFIGRQISDLFLCTGPSEVLARRHMQSAWVPLVVHILPPLLTWSEPSLRALVLIEATSEPAPTSETPRQATKSPEIDGPRNSRLTSSEPKRASARGARAVWAQ